MEEWLLNLEYLGLFIGTFLAGTVLTFSSDILLVGMLTIVGGDPWISMVCATLGNWLGVYTSYLLGWFAKWNWLEKWFKVKKEKLENQKSFVERYGVWIALFPWIPLIGNLLVIGLGFYKVRPGLSTVLLLIGCFLRFFVWTVLYVLYGQQFINWLMN
ncbi:MAG: DedA family protein [Tannerella sp.]|jgi:membrane protein YqaA with SNARE-associated domain|nr:DedA family protein [Tannerella sp.]